jgi:hypothetical protein
MNEETECMRMITKKEMVIVDCIGQSDHHTLLNEYK